MFTGFSEKTGAFLWDLAFNNERPWFLAHRQEFEDFVNTPFKALAEDTYALMGERMPEFEGMVHVSRIYRDARRLFGRGPYKDHLWFTVADARLRHEGPGFWFALGPADYSYGMGSGISTQTPRAFAALSSVSAGAGGSSAGRRTSAPRPCMTTPCSTPGTISAG